MVEAKDVTVNVLTSVVTTLVIIFLLIPLLKIPVPAVKETETIKEQKYYYPYVTPIEISPQIMFSSQATKNWAGDFMEPTSPSSGWIGYSFDSNGNFWFWTTTATNNFNLYKFTWATKTFELKAQYNNPGQTTYIDGMIITSAGAIYTLVSQPNVTQVYCHRLVSTGTISNPHAPDLNDYIWDSYLFPGVEPRLYGVFIDEKDNIYAYCRDNYVFIKRTGVGSFEYAVSNPVAMGDTIWHDFAVFHASNLYFKTNGYDFYRMKNVNPSVVNPEPLFELPDNLGLDWAALAFNPSDGKFYFVYMETLHPSGSNVLCFLYVNPEWLHD